MRTYIVTLIGITLFIGAGLLVDDVLPTWLRALWAVVAIALAWWFGIKAFKLALSQHRPD